MVKQLFRRGAAEEETEELLQPGNKAPDFELQATSIGNVSLSDFRGKPVVLVFYPADKSSVCSSQLALYNEALNLFDDYNAQLLGISVDDLQSHEEFSEDLRLGFPLLSDHDPKGAVARAYGVYDEKHKMSKRALFVVDDEGTIRWSYLAPGRVNPGANGILNALDSLKTNG